MDPINGKNIQDVSVCLDLISLCPELAIVYLDKLKETKEFGRKLVDITSCCVEYEADSVDEVLDLLDTGVNRVTLSKDHLRGFGQQLIPKDRITCEITAGPGISTEELAKEIHNLKENSSSFVLCCKNSKVDETSLVGFTKELKRSVCLDVRLVLSINQLISYSAISQLHSLGVQVQISAAWLLNELSLGKIITSCLTSDRPDELFPTLVVSGITNKCNCRSRYRPRGGSRPSHLFA